MGEAQTQAFQLSFNLYLRVGFQGSKVTSNGGLILVRELDERLGFGELIERHLTDARANNARFSFADLLGVGACISVSEHASGGGGVQSIIEIGGNVMAAGKSSRVNRQYKKKYRIRNWREYERGLRSRGDVTIWLSEDAIAAWVPTKNGLRGGQRRYSNLAVRTALTLRVVFSLPLRQTEGFLDSLLRLMGLNLKAPDHATLSRRNPIVAVPPLTRSYDGPIDLIVDSTGLKILGCGEWNAHKHKASKKRRDWRKLHIGVDAEGFIVAAELTVSSRDDASTLPALLDTIEVPIRRFTADGAYDHRSVYDQLSAAGTENVVIVIPSRRSAVSAGPTDGPWAQRDTALERIHQVGRREWQKESGYRQQARVENSFFRYKSVLGGGLKARHKGEKLRSGVTSSTGWPSWVGRNPALWCPEREVGKAPPLAPQLNHATAPYACTNAS